jgi:glutamate--cysteine ligase
MVGDHLAGGFLRTHSAKGPNESLNSPGAVFKTLCMSDLQIKMDCCVQENVYGWVTKLSLLAIARESAAMGVTYSDYH